MKKVKLSELGEIVGGSTPATKNIENYDGNISWITPKDLANYNKIFIESGERSITEKGFKSSSTKMLPKNSILFTSRAPIGYIAIAEKELCTNQGFKSIIPNNNVDYIFLYYLLKYNKEYIASFGSGTTFKEVSGTVMKNIEVNIPDTIEEQKKIANILYSIDKKIELNNQINDNLLNLLRASFKKYFIENLKKDWKEQKLENIVSIRRGASPRPIQKFLSSEGINWLKISDVTGIDSPFIYDIKEKIIEEGKSKSLFINKGTLVVSNSATPGIPKFIMIDTCVHDGWLVLSNFDYKYKNYLYFLIEQIRENLIKLANGSVFNNLKTDILKEYKFYNPDDDTLEKFNSIAEAMMNMINKNTTENKHLESIRDTLLPKLMNGEIDLDKIEI